MAQPFWIDTDIGGDIDDVIALIYALSTSTNIVGISTTGVRPCEKAGIVKLYADYFGQSLSVYPGIGYDESIDSVSHYRTLYPLWADNNFGSPGVTQIGNGLKPLYTGQGRAYPGLEHVPIQSITVPKAIANAVSNAVSNGFILRIITLGPMHNIAAFIEEYPELKDNVEIYIMGGYFIDSGLKFRRFGYNTGLNIDVMNTVFNSDFKIVVMNSGLEDMKQMNIKDDDFSLFNNTWTEGSIQQMMMNDWKLWDKTFDKRHIADPITVYIAKNPSMIKETEGIRITVDMEQLAASSNIDIFNMNETVDVKIETDPSSNVRFIRSLHDPAAVYNAIIDSTYQFFGLHRASL